MTTKRDQWKQGEAAIEIAKLFVGILLPIAVLTTGFILQSRDRRVAEFELLSDLFPIIAGSTEEPRAMLQKSEDELSHIPVTSDNRFYEPMLASQIVQLVLTDDDDKSLSNELVSAADRTLKRSLREQINRDMKTERYFDSIALIDGFRDMAKNNTEIQTRVERIISEAIEGTNLAEVLGRVPEPIPLDPMTVRLEPTAIGDIVCNALREEIQGQAAIVNGGSIRHQPGRDEIRDEVWTLDLFEVLPFPDFAIRLYLRGSVLRQAIEHGVALHGPLQRYSGEELPPGRYPQVAGIRFDVLLSESDPKKRVANLQIIDDSGESEEYVDVIDDEWYRIVTNEYLAHGGDGYSMLRPNGQDVVLEVGGDKTSRWNVKVDTCQGITAEGHKIEPDRHLLVVHAVYRYVARNSVMAPSAEFEDAVRCHSSLSKP